MALFNYITCRIYSYSSVYCTLYRIYRNCFCEINVFLLIADAFIRCRYILKEGCLYIQSGIFVQTEIAYANIKSFCESNNALSAPACSIDRIKIVYKNKKTGKESFTLVSPRNKQRFMKKLGAIIEVNK